MMSTDKSMMNIQFSKRLRDGSNVYLVSMDKGTECERRALIKSFFEIANVTQANADIELHHGKVQTRGKIVLPENLREVFEARLLDFGAEQAAEISHDLPPVFTGVNIPVKHTIKGSDLLKRISELRKCREFALKQGGEIVQTTQSTRESSLEILFPNASAYKAYQESVEPPRVQLERRPALNAG